jgi:Kef-type K+ transport system membrane component KefB
MLLLSALEFTLPLKNPVLLFAMILFIILFAPILLNKLKIPHLIGLIIAGALIGPFGLNLMLRDSSIVLFGTVGLLYIMFLAGLEIDMAEFKKNSGKSLTFGLLTFLIPMGFGTVSGYYLLNFTLPTSILMASMFASHTLIAYPIISKLGIVKNRAVNVTVGGTMVTDTLALLVLAGVTGLYTGKADQAFWIQLGISILVFGAIVMLLFPLIGRWFFKRFDDNVSQYIFVLSMVFLGGFLAEAAGVEAIIGAFLAGLALNRLIPHTSPLMNRIEFVGNALFIPFFLIGVGMLIDYRAFIQDWDTIKVAVVMTVMAELSKYLSAYFTQKIFGFTADERRVIFGLGSAHAAATLAIVLVGYNIILNTDAIADAAAMGFVLEPVRLLNESVLNGTILMILVTCTVASFVAQKGGQGIALAEAAEEGDTGSDTSEERILIPLSNAENVAELVNLSITVRNKKNRTGMYALSVIDEEHSGSTAVKKAEKLLDSAVTIASATDNQLQPLLRYDLNIVNGISSVVKENHITDLVMGLHRQHGITDSFLGTLTEGLLSRCNTTTLLYKSVQPLSTIKRHLIIVPDRAEKEVGFPFWLFKVWNIARNTGEKLVFYGAKETLDMIREVNTKHPVECDFHDFEDWNDFLILSRDVVKDDNLIIILSRPGHPSFNPNMLRVPQYMNKYFDQNSFILIYPMQQLMDDEMGRDLKNPSVLEPLRENLDRLDDLGKTLGRLFKGK